ncbi:acyl carrier protein [Silvimonas amylolytica]|uniref:Acyl carrier protein n=2 Tax=Silvimonas amylolytica TaxID=449663 RepID=A0ABQ2PN43_9NEIS|nr:acyl carrier protein [Silvimonas amylolytica]
MSTVTTMTKEEIYNWIAKDLVESFEADPARISPDARLYEDLDIDSIDAVDLIVKLKQVTGKRLQPEAFKSVRTINDVVEAVHQLIQH